MIFFFKRSETKRLRAGRPTDSEAKPRVDGKKKEMIKKVIGH